MPFPGAASRKIRQICYEKRENKSFVGGFSFSSCIFDCEKSINCTENRAEKIREIFVHSVHTLETGAFSVVFQVLGVFLSLG